MRPVAVMTRKSRIMCFLGVDIGGTSVRSSLLMRAGKYWVINVLRASVANLCGRLSMTV